MSSSRVTVVAVVSLLWVVPSNAAPVKGVTINPAGQPIPNCRVVAYALEGSETKSARYQSDKPERKPLASATSNAAGEFLVDVPVARTYTLQFEAAGFAPASTLVANGEEIGAILLSPAGMKKGSVHAAGKTVAGARVFYLGSAEITAVSDAAGNFQLPDPASWGARVVVLHPDFAIVDLSRAGNQLPLSFELTAGSHVVGSVFGTDGKTPAAGASIRVGQWELGQSAPDGTFDVSRAPANITEVMASSGKSSGRGSRKGNEKVVIRLSPDSSVRGRVVDIKGKLPLSGAIVTLGSRGLELSALSGPKGDFIFERVAPGSYVESAGIPGYSITPQSVTVAAGAAVSRDVNAVRGGVISGTVADEDKRPSAGAPIFVVGKIDTGFFAAREPSAYSDPTGRYLVRLVEPDRDIQAMARKAGEPEARSAAVKLAPGERRDKLPITIPRGLTMRGKVVDADGKPLAAVRIISSEQTENSQWEWPAMLRAWKESQQTLQTAADGTFSLRLKEGTYLVGYRLRGYALQELRNVKVEKNAEPLHVVMERGASISGKVQHAVTGAPVADAAISVSEQPLMPVITGPDGSFSIDDLEPGESFLSASKPDESIRVQKKVTIPSQNVVLEVPRGETISGHVFVKSSGSPVTDFQVVLGTGRMMTPPRQIHSADGSFLLENVAAGALDLTVTAPGFVAKKVNGLIVEEGKPIKDLEVLVEPGVRVTGTVTGPDDEPLSGVYVQAQKKEGAPSRDFFDPSRTNTDNAGAFSMDAVEPGEKVFVFQKQGYSSERRPLDVQGKEVRVDVRLTKGRSLQGRVVTSEGAPVADAIVNAFAPGAQAFTRATTDATGQFTLDGLGAFRYTVEAQKKGFTTATKKDVDAASVKSLELVLDRGGRLHGAIRGATKKQLDQATVFVEGSQHFAEAPVSADGSYRMEGVPTGTVKVSLDISATGGERTVQPKTLDVAVGTDVEVNFDLQAGSVVRGRVTREGKPVTTAQVRFGSTEPGRDSYGAARTDENGAYSIEGLTPGNFRVSVTDIVRYTRLFSGSHDVTGSETYDIDIRSTAVRGRVVDDAGKGIDGAVVTLDSLDFKDAPLFGRPSATTAASGEFTVSGVSEGKFKVIAQKDLYTEAFAEVTVDAGGSQPVELTMKQAKGLLVRVVDRRDGHPLMAGIAVLDRSGSLVFERAAYSSASDSVRVVLPDGQYSLTASVYEYATKTVPLQVPSADVVISLSPGGTMTITLSGAESRVGQLVDGSGTPYRRSAYRPDGKFEIRAGTTTIYSIDPGAYVLRVYDSGGKVENAKAVVIKEGEATAVSF